MAYTKKTWKARVSEYPNRRTLVDTTSGTSQTVTVSRNEGTVSEEGDAFSKANMDDLEDRINTAFNQEHRFLSQTLAAGATTVQFTDNDIDSNCIPHILVPIEKNKLVPNTIVFTSPHTLTVTFPAQNSSTVIKLRIEHPLLTT